MGVGDFIRRLITNDQNADRFELVVDHAGLKLILPPSRFKACMERKDTALILHQYVYLQMLEEQGLAMAFPNGFAIPAESATLLEDDALTLLDLPQQFTGSYKTRVRGQTRESGFSIQIIPVLLDGTEVPSWKLKGSCLQLSPQESYLLRTHEMRALHAQHNHQQLSDTDRTEQLNLKLVGTLQAAKRSGMDIDLAHFNDLEVIEPDKVGVAARENDDGSLSLISTFGTGIDPDNIDKRLGQIPLDADIASMHVQNRIILLDEDRLKAVHEILFDKVCDEETGEIKFVRRKIPHDRIKDFMEAPSAFLDATLVDLDTGFSLCVKGATRFTYFPIGETDASGIDWFRNVGHEEPPDVLLQLIKSNEELESLKPKLEEARGEGAQNILIDNHLIDISDNKEVDRVIDEIESKLKEGQESKDTPTKDSAEPSQDRATPLLGDVASEANPLDESDHYYQGTLDFSVYRRKPFPHQEEGVRWLLGLWGKSIKTLSDSKGLVKGALLADDMGLGKTYMALVAINEIYKRLKEIDKPLKPVMVVAPLSLIETWQEEIKNTFTASPFKSIIVLQAGQDLLKYRIHGTGAETKQQFGEEEVLGESAIRYSLKIGRNFGPDRLDLPRRLVLTTYQTLRNYQFSLCRVDWAVVVFDEAQNIKNPNVLQTRAAKGLKADFKLLATGTPVENSLCDFWCLMDTAKPGLLGTWSVFRDKYVRPIKQAKTGDESEVRLDIGKKLRSDVGSFMLRRMKEDHLDGLPAKRIYCGVDDEADDRLYSPVLGRQMSGSQLERYDSVISKYHSQAKGGDQKGRALATLHHLRDISLHPGLENKATLTSQEPFSPEEFFSQSGKVSGALKLIYEIRSRQEKVIIFLINKRLQLELKIALQQHYKISIGIINGDTKAVANRGGSETRKTLIKKFEDNPGFGIIIMSPIAAGVGLTVVGANNVIHLERHWNPAKEAQATDRVYRIGQKKDVNIYLPILHHPGQVSFDRNLDMLLQRKSNLKDAVVTPETVQPQEMGSIFPEEVRSAFTKDTGFRLTYKQYLKSPLWAKNRREAISVAGGKCTFCGTNRRLEVHHKKYPKRFEEDSLDNLVVVCNDHHRKIHGVKRCDLCNQWAVLSAHNARTPRGMARDDVSPILNLCIQCSEELVS